jgi:SOS regulatory protein LexA
MYEKYKNKITGFYRQNKRLPSYAEIMKLLSFKSKNAVAKLVDKLVEEGIVEKDSKGRLTPRNIFGEVKVLGVVEAGFGSHAEEELLDTMSLDEYMIGNKDATYMLKVKGESMIDAGMLPGDMVIVERGSLYRSGDIVIAEIDGGFTMKYYKKLGDKIWLEPANEKFKPMHPKEDLKVVAVVKGVIRKY